MKKRKLIVILSIVGMLFAINGIGLRFPKTEHQSFFPEGILWIVLLSLSLVMFIIVSVKQDKSPHK